MIRQKYFIKMFISISTLVFLFAFLTTGIFFIRDNRREIEKVHSINKQLIEQTADKTDYILKSSWNLRNNLRLNNDVQRYAQNKDYYYSVTQVYKELQKSQSSFSNLHYDVGITKKDDEIVIMPSGTTDIKNYYDYLGLDDKQFSELNKYFENSSLRKPILFQTKLNTNNKREAFIMVSKERIPFDSQIYIFMIFYSDYFFPYTTDYGYESLFIYNGDKVFYNNKNEKIDILDEKINTTYLETILKEDDMPITLEVSNEKYFLYFQKSEMNNIYYFMIKSEESYFARITRLMGYYVFILLFIIFASILLSFLTAKRTYRPINNIVRQFKKYGEDPMKDEILFINDTIKKIHRTNIKMEEIIEKNKMSLKNMFFRKLSLGLLSEDEIKKDLIKYNLDKDNENWIACVIEFADNTRNKNDFTRDVSVMIRTQIIDFLKGQIDKRIYNELFELDYFRSVLLVQEESIDNVIIHLKKTLAIIEMNFKMKLTASVGEPVDRIEYISKSVKDAIKLLDDRLIFDNRMILSNHLKKEQTKKETYYYPLNIEENLINYTIEGKEKEALDVLNYIINENLFNRNIDRNTQNIFLISFSGTIHRILNKINKRIEDFYEEGSRVLLELKMQKNREDIHKKAKEIFVKIIDEINQQNEVEFIDLAGKMVSYIHRNYMKDIYLIDMAQYFNMSIGYIGKAFKNHTGENFKDYLNKYRVGMSIEIMKNEPNVKVKELSYMVGCNNSNTFIRMFKKYEGISPGQYQKNININ